MRWARERDYDVQVNATSIKYGVSRALIKAVIGAESAFNPQATRIESPRLSLPPTPDFPNGGDKSYGLMQLLSRTARGLGYAGPLVGLLDAGKNIDLGTKLLAQNMRMANGHVADSVSAYNGGFRPALGFGAVRPTTGQYQNQAYVTRVLDLQRYFLGEEGQSGETSTTFPDVAPPRTARPAHGVPGRPATIFARWLDFWKVVLKWTGQ